MIHTAAVITEQKSDFSLFLETIPHYQMDYIRPQDIAAYDLSIYEFLVLLGGTEEKPMELEAQARIQIEQQLAAGKKIFSEYVSSIADVYTAPVASTRFKRLVVSQEIAGLAPGNLLEDQCNQYAQPYFSKRMEEPLLYYKEFASGHDQTEIEEQDKAELSGWALWKERPQLMICAFRLCNFVKARFAPLARWQALVRMIAEWLTGEHLPQLTVKQAYWLAESAEEAHFETQLRDCIELGRSWYHEAGMLLENGKRGVYEGMMTEIHPDGSQALAKTIRTDCAGEASLAFFADYLLTSSRASLKTSDELEAFCYTRMQIQGGPYDGMLRWTNLAWNVCYQDDNARVIIPSLLKMMYTGDTRYLDACCRALEFLQKTTGPDGLRVMRTDNYLLDEAEMERLAKTPADFPCAHYNAYFAAALLLCGKLAGREDFVRTGITGMESLMAAYPQTIREHSETQELCRLILPLAWLYQTTGQARHREWLYRVTQDLQKMKRAGGAYAEWDSGYQAACSQKENGECSLLSQNGDPVVDLLYSVNWLPLAFWQSYLVTGDSYFYTLWKETAGFMIRTQIHSENPMINGGWARGFDVEKWEVYGIPNDIGWGPWAIESGWTVSEILAGLAFGLADAGVPRTELAQRFYIKR